MYKIILLCILVTVCHSQLAIPGHQYRHQQYTYQPIFKVEGLLPQQPVPVATVAHQPVAVAQQPIAVEAVAQQPQPLIQSQVHYSQEILPVQELGSGPLPAHFQGRVGPQVVQLGSDDDVPVVVHFQTRSARVQVEQSHHPSAPGEVTITRSEDEPHRVIHEVIRPVIQEVREIIQPYRRLSQEVRPVDEAVHTSVAAQSGAVPAPTPVAAQQVFTAQQPAQVVLPHSQSNVQQNVPAQTSFTSYIQQIVDQIRARNAQQPAIAGVNSRHQLTVQPVAQ